MNRIDITNATAEQLDSLFALVALGITDPVAIATITQLPIL